MWEKNVENASQTEIIGELIIIELTLSVPTTNILESLTQSITS